MTIKEKIELIEKGLVWSVCNDVFWLDGSSLPGCLLDKKLIDNQEFEKLIKLKTNFYDYSYKNQNLNSDSILLINIAYNLIKNETQERTTKR
jgi:hypothetical protein